MTANALVIKVATPAAHLITGHIPSILNSKAAQTYESAGLSGIIGDGPIIELADTSGRPLYQVNINFPGNGLLDPAGSTGNSDSLDEYSDGTSVTVVIPRSRLQGISNSFLWQFIETNDASQEVCPANNDQTSYLDALSSSAAAQSGFNPNELSGMVLTDFGRYPSGSEPPLVTTIPTTTTTTVPCSGSLVVKLAGVTMVQSNDPNGSPKFTGTVTNNTNRTIQVTEIVFDVNFPPAYASSWDAKNIQGLVNESQYIGPGQTETWSLSPGYPEDSNGHPVIPTLVPVGFAQGPNQPPIALDRACAAQTSR